MPAVAIALIVLGGMVVTLSHGDSAAGAGRGAWTAPVTTVTPGGREGATSTAAEAASSPEDPSLIVAGLSGITRITSSGAVRLVSGPVWVAIDDLGGGVVFQRRRPTWGAPPEPIWWLPADTGRPIVIVDPAVNILVEPYEVAVIGGEPTLIYTARDSSLEPWSDVDHLVLLGMSNGAERIIADVGVFEQHPVAISYGSGRLLISATDSTGSWFELLNESGTFLTWATNPHPVDDYDDKLVHGVLAPDGKAVAYSVEPGVDGNAFVVIGAVVSGTEALRAPLPLDENEWIWALDFDGESVIATVGSETGPVRWFLVSAQGSITERPAWGTARFAATAP